MSLSRDSLSPSLLLLRFSAVVLSVVWFIALCISWRWPLVGDEGIIHYVVFLWGQGHTPYSWIKDLNLPGSYFLDAFVMKYLGSGDGGERLYDILLGIIGAIAAVSSALPNRKRALAALLASQLFILIHLQDGIMETGQRDYAMAVFAMCAYALLTREWATISVRTGAFYLVMGFSATIKPTMLPLIVLPFLIPQFRDRISRFPTQTISIILISLSAIPLTLMMWLLHRAALNALYENITLIGALHGQLERRSIWFLLLHSVSPLNELFLGWVIVVILKQIVWTIERQLLAFCAVVGLFSYIAQGKGLSYHRYPFLFFIVMLILSDLVALAWSRDWRRYLGSGAIAVCAMVIAPLCLWRVIHFDPQTPFEDALSHSLIETGRVRQGGIQCLDTYVGCHNTLYRLRVSQSTGYLYDCYLTMPDSPLRDRYRREFFGALQAQRPGIIVVTDQPCFKDHQGFQWIANWGELSKLMQDDYILTTEWSSQQQIRWWNRAGAPASFRIYLRR